MKKKTEVFITKSNKRASIHWKYWKHKLMFWLYGWGQSYGLNSVVYEFNKRRFVCTDTYSHTSASSINKDVTFMSCFQIFSFTNIFWRPYLKHFYCPVQRLVSLLLLSTLSIINVSAFTSVCAVPIHFKRIIQGPDWLCLFTHLYQPSPRNTDCEALSYIKEEDRPGWENRKR